MFEFQQLFLIILISTLTVLVVIFSIFVFRILQEFRDTLKKVNKILDDVGVISSSVSGPVSGLSDLVSGLRSGMRIFDVIAKVAHRDKDDDDDDEEESDDE